MQARLTYTLGTCATLGMLVGVLLAARGQSKTQETAQAVALPDVEVVQVAQQDVPIYSEWIGTLDGMVNAVMTAQVSGYLLRQVYREGSFIKKGELIAIFIIPVSFYVVEKLTGAAKRRAPGVEPEGPAPATGD